MDAGRLAKLPSSLQADGVLLAGLTYWASVRPGSELPGVEEIDPTRLPRHVLPFIVLADLEGDRVRYRLVGTSMCERWGSDFTGKYLDEIMSGEYADFIHGLFLSCRTAAAPVYSESLFRWDIGRVLWTRRVMLPFVRRPGGEIRVMVVQTFGGEATGDRKPWASVVLDNWEAQSDPVVLSVAAGGG